MCIQRSINWRRFNKFNFDWWLSIDQFASLFFFFQRSSIADIEQNVILSVWAGAVPNNRILEYSIDGSNIRLVFSGSNNRIKNTASTTKILNLYFLIVISPIILIIMWRNYQSAVFKYRIFDRNPNPNIRLLYYSKSHSSSLGKDLNSCFNQISCIIGWQSTLLHRHIWTLDAGSMRKPSRP